MNRLCKIGGVNINKDAKMYTVLVSRRHRHLEDLIAKKVMAAAFREFKHTG
jgi:hypothetical protein